MSFAQGRRVERARKSGERGVTLIEMVVTLAIMTVAVVGIGAGLAQTEYISAINQDQAQLEVAMRQLSDYSRDSALPKGLVYKVCAKTSDYSAGSNSDFPALPVGVTSWGISVVGLSTAGSRDGVPTKPLNYCGTQGICSNTNPCDWGVQELTLFVSNGSHTLTRTAWKSSSW